MQFVILYTTSGISEGSSLTSTEKYVNDVGFKFEEGRKLMHYVDVTKLHHKVL